MRSRGALVYFSALVALGGGAAGCANSDPIDPAGAGSGVASSSSGEDVSSAGETTGGLGGSGGSTSDVSSSSSGSPGVCGDAAIDAGEECDDGNGMGDDGCTACVIDCPAPGKKNGANHHCYQVFASLGTWPSAEANCEAWGGASGLGHLVSIGEATEQSFVSGFVTDNAWIGAQDPVVRGDFEWVDQTPWLFEAWATGKPDGSTIQNCVFMRSDGGWDDNPCGSMLPLYVCERLPAGQP